jgi:hypothetical protein
MDGSDNSGNISEWIAKLSKSLASQWKSVAIQKRIGVDNQIGQVIEVNGRSMEVSCDSGKKIRVDN